MTISQHCKCWRYACCKQSDGWKLSVLPIIVILTDIDNPQPHTVHISTFINHHFHSLNNQWWVGFKMCMWPIIRKQIIVLFDLWVYHNLRHIHTASNIEMLFNRTGLWLTHKNICLHTISSRFNVKVKYVFKFKVWPMIFFCHSFIVSNFVVCWIAL